MAGRLYVGHLQNAQVRGISLRRNVDVNKNRGPRVGLMRRRGVRRVLRMVNALPSLRRSVLHVGRLRNFRMRRVTHLAKDAPITMQAGLSETEGEMGRRFVVRDGM